MTRTGWVRAAKLATSAGMLGLCLGVLPEFPDETGSGSRFVLGRCSGAGKGMSGCKGSRGLSGCKGCSGCGHVPTPAPHAPPSFSPPIPPRPQPPPAPFPRTQSGGVRAPSIGVRPGVPPGTTGPTLQSTLGHLPLRSTRPILTHTSEEVTATSLEQTVHRIELLPILPKDEASFVRTYGRAYAYEAEELRRISGLMGTLKSQGTFGVHELSPARKELEAAILGAREDATVIVAGHSVADGSRRMLVLPDGTHVPFDDLHRLAGTRGRTLLILSCHSGDFGLSRSITWDAVHAGLASVGARMKTTTIRVEDLVAEVRASIAAEHRSRLVVTILTAGAAGGTYALAEIAGDDAPDPPPDDPRK